MLRVPHTVVQIQFNVSVIFFCLFILIVILAHIVTPSENQLSIGDLVLHFIYYCIIVCLLYKKGSKQAFICWALETFNSFVFLICKLTFKKLLP